MLWESLQRPTCSPGICDDMQDFFFLSGGYGSVCVCMEGGVLFSVSMTTMSALTVIRYHPLPVSKFLSQSEKCLYI